MPGGRIAPDGRPAQAPGVGKNSKRHDLEAPATPGLHGSDLQQGDVQALEQAQRVAPRPKKQQPKAAPAPRGGSRRSSAANGEMEVPDPIQFAAERVGGKTPSASIPQGQWVDPRPWMPLLEEFATRPVSNPKIAAAYVQQISKLQRQPYSSGAHFVDMNEADDILEGS